MQGSRALLMMMTLTAALAACAPPKEEVQFAEARHQFGPQRQDVDLQLGQTGVKTTALSWEGESSSAIFYRLNENLMFVMADQSLNATPLKAWINGWWPTRPVEKQTLVNGAYVNLLLERTEKSAHPGLHDILNRIDKEKDALADDLRKSKAEAVKPSTPLQKQADVAFAFLSNFERGVAARDLQPAFKAALQDGVAKERARLTAVVQKALADFKNAKTLTRTLNILEALLKSEGVELDSADKKSLQEGRHLGSSVDKMKDEKDALAVLVEIWFYLTPKQRLEIFQPINADLYDFMKKQPEDSLRCLQGAPCNNLITYIAKNAFILPKIRDFGVEKIRSRINAEGSDQVQEVIGKTASDKIKTLGSFVADALLKRVNERLGELHTLDNDFSGDLRRRLAEWSEKGPGGALYAEKALPTRVKVSLQPGQRKVEFIPTEKNDLESDGALAGLASTLTAEKWLPDESMRRWFLSEFNRVAVMAPVPPTALAKDHAEILRGLSLLTVPLRDFEQSSFEDLFSFASAQQLFPKIQAEELNQSLFPKDALYALSLSKLGDYLKLITTRSTPVFLLDLDNRVTWANDYDFERGSQAVMAGVVDRGEADQGTVVRSANVSRYLLSLCEFLRSTGGVERSKSPYLREEQNGQIPLKQLTDARSKLKLLAVALANYLSHQMRRGDGLIDPSVGLPSQRTRYEVPSLTDQALAMRALAEVSETLGIELYRWEAMDILSSMNSNLYRRELGFYSDDFRGSRRPSLPVMIETLRALGAIEPLLPAQSRAQVHTIRTAWQARVTELFKAQ